MIVVFRSLFGAGISELFSSIMNLSTLLSIHVFVYIKSPLNHVWIRSSSVKEESWPNTVNHEVTHEK